MLKVRKCRPEKKILGGYGYDLNGNGVEQIETRYGEAAETTTYTYDLADRLRQVAYPDKTTDYTYDAAGNRETEQDRDPAGVLQADKLYSYDDRNRLIEVTDAIDASRSVSYGFDANGNQISRTPSSGAFMGFVFDVRDRLIRVEEDALPIGSYRYDASGLRVSKFTATGEARYVYDDRSVLVHSDDNGTTKFEYGPDRLLSVNHPVDGRAFYLFDALGSVVDLTTPGGSLLAQYQWDAWGNLRSSTDTAANPFGFTGHEMDGESGLVYARARFYDPVIGRFLSHDPEVVEASNPPSLHRYLYAYQNPTVFVDPTGRKAELTFAAEKMQEFADDPEKLQLKCQSS